jgi:hypothetical protein
VTFFVEEVSKKQKKKEVERGQKKQLRPLSLSFFLSTF